MARKGANVGFYGQICGQNPVKMQEVIRYDCNAKIGYGNHSGNIYGQICGQEGLRSLELPGERRDFRRLYKSAKNMGQITTNN